MQTLAADRIILLLQVHVTFHVTFVIFVVIVAYDVAIFLFQICINSPVHPAIRAIRYNNPSHKWRNLKITICMQCCHVGWLSHETRGWLSLCESMPDNPDCVFQCWSLYFQR